VSKNANTAELILKNNDPELILFLKQRKMKWGFTVEAGWTPKSR